MSGSLPSLAALVYVRLSVSYGQLRKADDTLPAFRRMCFFRIYV